MRRRPIAFAFVSVPIDTPLLYADSLADNVLCGVNKYGEGTYTTEGITKLCEALKGSAVTSLKCAAARAFAFLSAPIDTHLLSHCPRPTPWQYLLERHRARGRLRARCCSQGDADHQSQVRRRPLVFAFVSAPIDTPPSLGSLARNQLCGLDFLGNGTYTAEGITKLCEALKGSTVTSLKCAATPERLLLCQRPLTRTCPLALPASPILSSIWGNKIGDKGASALAAVLKETRISQLECAAAEECSRL